MAQKFNATCGICDKKYHMCLSCRDSARLRPWQAFTCSAAHYQVFQVINGYNTGVYNKEEAKEKFKNVDLSELESFRPNIRDTIKNIIKEDKKDIKPIIEHVIEVDIESDVSDKDIIEADIQKSVYSRKRKINVDNVEADVEQSVF